MNKLVRIPGIVISASVLSARATKLHLQCRACRSTKIIYPPSGLGGLGGGSDRGLPRVCDAPELENQKKDCPLDPYLIIHSKSAFTDHQTLKLQEAPDMVPVGELPRHMLLSADRYLTGQVVPGSRVIATGVYSTYQSSNKVRPCGCCVHRGCLTMYIALKGCSCLARPLPPRCSSGGLLACCRWCGRCEPLRCAIHPGRGRRIRRDGSQRGLLRTLREERCSQYLRQSRSVLTRTWINIGLNDIHSQISRKRSHVFS